jgi:hypothetical protein
MHLKLKTSFMLALFTLWTAVLAANDRVYRNYSNPTEYVFSVPIEEVVTLLRGIHGPRSWGPLAGSYFEDKGTYGFGVFDYYTTRYWVGRQERHDEIEPPEAGRIGTIQCDFTARITARDESHTLIRVTPDTFEQQVGRRFRIFPHFQKAPVLEKVKSDTYFEYLFLTKLGALLGEKDMPPIRGGENEAASERK